MPLASLHVQICFGYSKINTFYWRKLHFQFEFFGYHTQHQPFDKKSLSATFKHATLLLLNYMLKWKVNHTCVTSLKERNHTGRA